MALPAPDMKSCSPKERCLHGVNEGLAYDKASPCPPTQVFDPTLCDCIGGWYVANWRVYFTRESSGQKSCVNGTDINTTACYSQLVTNSTEVYANIVTTTDTACCGNCGNPAAQYANVFTIYYTKANGDQSSLGTGYWYADGSARNSDQVEGTATNIWQITGIKNEDTGVFLYGHDCNE